MNYRPAPFSLWPLTCWPPTRCASWASHDSTKRSIPVTCDVCSLYTPPLLTPLLCRAPFLGEGSLWGCNPQTVILTHHNSPSVLLSRLTTDYLHRRGLFGEAFSSRVFRSRGPGAEDLNSSEDPEGSVGQNCWPISLFWQLFWSVHFSSLPFLFSTHVCLLSAYLNCGYRKRWVLKADPNN